MKIKTKLIGSYTIVGLLIVILAYIHVGEKHDAAARDIALLSSVISLVLTVLLGVILSSSITGSINKLKSAAHDIARGNLKQRIRLKEKSELSALANSFNVMADELSRRIERERSLSQQAASEVASRKKADELKRAYKELQDAQDMLLRTEKLNVIGQLASGVAHEVKNPLGVIIQGVDYLDKAITSKEADTAKVLSMIRESVLKADKIVQLLLDFSRATKIDLKPADLAPVLKNAIYLVQRNPSFNNIKIITDIKPHMPKVIIDNDRVEQVFINLLMNGIQAMPDGGELAVCAYSKRLETLAEGVNLITGSYFKPGEDVVMVEIEDNGIGISEENIQKVLDPFFTTKGPKKGTGLGLSVCHRILDLHKAGLKIQSQLGEGTKVTLMFKTEQEGKNV